jgi:hypothetical protein
VSSYRDEHLVSQFGWFNLGEIVPDMAMCGPYLRIRGSNLMDGNSAINFNSVLKMESSNFWMMVQQSASTSDDNVHSDVWFVRLG